MAKVKETIKQEICESKHTEILKIAKLDKEQFIIICGDARMSNKIFKTKTEAENYIGYKPYELLVNLMFYTMQKVVEYENKKENANAETTKETAKTN